MKRQIEKGAKMKIEKNRIIYNDIKGFIVKHFPSEYDELKEDNCFHITVFAQEEDCPIWFEFDIEKDELIVGYGISHIHYGKRYGIKTSEGLNQVLDFFISKIKRIDYYKGKVNFKSVYEIKKEKGTFKNLGTSSAFLFPFWKKTTKKVTEYSELIKDENIKTELDRIRKIINNI